MLRLVGIGALGNMLSPAAIHLSENSLYGSFIRIYDHNPMNKDKQDRRDSWIAHGAQLVTSIEELIGKQDIDGVVICAGKNGDDLHLIATVLEKICNQYSEQNRPFILHCSTVSVDFVEQAYKACQKVNVQYVNYPLTGGAKGAKEATMLILASGDLQMYQRLEPVLNLLGKPRYFDHNISTAAKVKLIGHLMVFNGLIGMSSAVTLQETAIKLNPKQQTEFFDFLNQGAGGSRQWEVTLKQAISDEQWQTGFLLPHAVIDAIYTADLLIKSKMSIITILPILNLAATFTHLLQDSSNKQLATQTVLKALTQPKELDRFVEAIFDLNAENYLEKIILSLPNSLGEKVRIKVTVQDFFSNFTISKKHDL